jgi:hypothetical protein
MKDIDDFILQLVRNPRFSALVNDIVVECGNSRYQSMLDRYFAGEDVPLTDVRQAWRNTTVPQMCSVSFISWPAPPSPPIDDFIDPVRVREQDVDPFLCNPNR